MQEEAGKAIINDLTAPGVASALQTQIKADIDKYCAETYDDGHRNHLGASLIGRDCKRYLWYVFRWCFHEKFSGRQQRLFNRGHREEDRFIEWLEGIGFQVFFEDRETDPLYYVAESEDYFKKSELLNQLELVQELARLVKPEERKHFELAKAKGIKFNQYRISGVNGHFGGSLDGILIAPARYGLDKPILTEFKTNGTGAGFNKLCTNGMPVEKPEHYAQTSTYGYKYNFEFCLYLNINKNDDDLHCELVKLDHKLGAQMEQKAEQIIMSQTPPARLSDNPTFFKCQYCAMKGICHRNEPIEKNCRSCAFASPVECGQWFCQSYSANIPSEYIVLGCNEYKAIA